jgi:hypothetical protein
MPVITLDEMSHIRLMDRIDTKYVAHLSLLPRILDLMEGKFKVQIIDDNRIANYATQYFDTEALDFFTMHQNGKLNRQKIRIRSYMDSNLSFLEIKNKNNKGRTSKKRIATSVSHVDSVDNMNDGEKVFLNSNSLFETRLLTPVLENNFQRMTFVNKNESERITVDLNLSFKNYLTGDSRMLDDLVVLELKQDGWQRSDFAAILQQLRIMRSSFSKYCMGTVLTNSDVKYNRFKRKIRFINKFQNLSL